ncbi:MAG: hypothetical protein MUE94_07895 [Verrucomicrobia bacterium]|nr:hypothetical protein [Verrucomicrobiota bacterium]
MNRVARLLMLVPVLLTCPGWAEDLPAYRLGEEATNDVITTKRLLVVDEEATRAIQDEEAAKIPLFVVYSTNHAAFIESEVWQAVTRLREEFLAVLQARYGTHRLQPEVIASQGFQDIAEQFLAVNPGPPVPAQALSRWAGSATGEEFLESWFAPLRQVLSRPVCPDELPGGGPIPDHLPLNLTPVADLAWFVKEGYALSNATRTSSGDLIPLSTARRALRAAFPDGDAASTGFMVEQLQPNCRFDTNLTQRAKAFAVSGLVRMRQFEPGEVVIRKGQRIDEPALAALSEMREAAKVVHLEQQLAVNRVSVQLLGERNLWLAGLLGGTGLVFVLLLVRSHRLRRRALMPVLSSSLVPAAPETRSFIEANVVEAPPGEEEQWRRRALEAERHVERVQRLARSSLMPHLAQQLKDNVVQQLATQMDDMLEVQAAVAEQLAAMEERLERVQAPLQDRLRAYEQRITELQLELAQRGQENQVLLRARIEALRWQLDQERARAHAGAN